MMSFKRFTLCRRKQLLLALAGVCVLSLYFTVRMVYSVVAVDEEAKQWEEKMCKNYSEKKRTKSNGNKYTVTWYDVMPYVKFRKEALKRDFKPCKYNNCEMSLCKRTAEYSDAVLFNGRRLPKTYEFKRPVGQIWIFAEDETPYTYNSDTGQWKSKFWRPAFNWTMTYDRKTADIYLSSGEIWKKNARDSRDFRRIAKNKSKDALLISSHCSTESKRMEFVKELQKYIDVDVLGTCGRKWDCGKQWVHDDCFEILNTTYRYYLAFENALCRGYRTEKFFENFDYDILLVARGGISKEDDIEPKDVYISTSDFSDVASLGRYLKKLSNDVDEYSRMLEKKSQYYFSGFHEPYQTALCNLCEMMNEQDKHRRNIDDMLTEHARLLSFCRDPTDVPLKSSIFDWLFSKW